MLTIARLFGKSPFAPLQTHMSRVAKCVEILPALFQAIHACNQTEIEQFVLQISKLEYDADLTRNDIRTHLPTTLFLPIDRNDLLDILDLQDKIADLAESIAHLAAIRTIPLSEAMQAEFSLFCQKNLEAFHLVHAVINELDELLESSFGGIEAEKVKGMIEQIAFFDYENHVQKRKLLKAIYCEDSLPYPLFHLLLQLIEQIGLIASLSEKLGNRVRTLLELK